MAHFQLVDNSHPDENSDEEDSGIQNKDSSTEFNESTDEAEVTFELIKRVGNRQLLFDSEDPHHKNRHLMTKAWMDVADGLYYRGSLMTWKKCRDKWRNLRIYYFRIKRERKGKSGDGRTNFKPWIFYQAVHNIMQRCASENEDTTSNMDDGLASTSSFENPQTTPESDETLPQTTDEASPSPSVAPKPSRKRKISKEDETSKIIDLLRSSGKDEDEFFHFGMNLAEKLRKMEPQKAALAQIKITSLVYEIEFME